jgi:hypothetical protein
VGQIGSVYKQPEKRKDDSCHSWRTPSKWKRGTNLSRLEYKSTKAGRDNQSRLEQAKADQSRRKLTRAEES